MDLDILFGVSFTPTYWVQGSSFPPRTPPPPHSPEEIKVDGGELALDEGPECPEEVRRLKTHQRRSV